jgi:hypothetical protein
MEESGILQIVKEDILRILAEKTGKKSPLEFVKPSVKCSRPFMSKAVKELDEENPIQLAKDAVRSTNSQDRTTLKSQYIN